MQSIKQVAVFSASMVEDKVRSPLEAAADSPPSPDWPSPYRTDERLSCISQIMLARQILRAALQSARNVSDYLCFVMLLAHNLWIYTKSQSQTPENTASTAGWNDFVVGVRTRAMKCDQFMTYRNDSDYVQSYRILAVVGL